MGTKPCTEGSFDCYHVVFFFCTIKKKERKKKTSTVEFWQEVEFTTVVQVQIIDLGKQQGGVPVGSSLVVVCCIRGLRSESWNRLSQKELHPQRWPNTKYSPAHDWLKDSVMGWRWVKACRLETVGCHFLLWAKRNTVEVWQRGRGRLCWAVRCVTSRKLHLSS